VEPVRVLIVDDRPAMRIGLRTMLSAESSLEVVGECESACDALALAADLHPDVVLVDASMPDGKEAILSARLRATHTDVKLVFLVDRRLDAIATELPVGADAYIPDSASQQSLVATVVAVSQGQRSIDPGCAGPLLEQHEAAVRELVRHRLGLSDEEVDLLRKLADGATNQEIAAGLYLSEITVIRKVQHVVAKLGATNKTQAVAEAVRRCII